MCWPPYMIPSSSKVLVVLSLLSMGPYEPGLTYWAAGGAIAEVKEAIEPVRLVEKDVPVE